MLRSLLCLVAFLFAFAQAADAEPEVHVVGIYEGFFKSGGKIHGPTARVVLDRPDREVILVLSSYDATKWEVELARGTTAPTIVLSQRVDGGRQSEVWLDGSPVPDPVKMRLPLTYKPVGEDFRALVALVPDRFGVSRMASFTGAYAASEWAFVIDSVVTDPSYELDPLKDALSRMPVPPALRPLIGPAADTEAPAVRLSDRGFEVMEADGSISLYPLPLDMPGVSWPMGAVRDPVTGTLYGVTLGGEGYLYAYTEATKAWRIVRSMEQMDAQGLFLDVEGRRLIMTVGFVGPEGLAVIDLAKGDDSPLKIAELAGLLPGYTDLYDPGNGPAPRLAPRGIAGDWLLLVAGVDPAFRRAGGDTSGGPWRAYLVDLATMTTALVGYGNGG